MRLKFFVLRLFRIGGFLLSIFLAEMLFCQWLKAEVTRIEILERVPFLGGITFGNVGSYEKIKGRLHYSIDPDNPSNSRITDLHYAPRNQEGNIEFSGEFLLIKPLDMKKGNHRLLYDVTNRGNLNILSVLNSATWTNNPSKLIHAGNGFLMRLGYTLLWSEWNWDVKPGNGRLQIDIPYAKNNGKPISQKIAVEIVTSRRTKSYAEPLCWGNAKGYPAADPDDPKDSELTVRDEPRDKRRVIPHDYWQFARLEKGISVADPTWINLKTGFEPGKIYELIYTVKNPPIVGFGFAAVRDAISFFRYKIRDAHGQLNPLIIEINQNSINGNNYWDYNHNRTISNINNQFWNTTNSLEFKPYIEKAYIFGLSQSGRFVTDMIYQGFHVDEKSRMVFDGARIHIAGAGKGGFNQRFAQTSQVPGHLESNYMPADFFPFNYAPQEDPITGEYGGLLETAKKMGKIPYIIVTNNELEYWARGASLIHTDVTGKKDSAVNERVRIYFTCGAPHFTGKTRYRYIYEHSLNILNHYPISRALLVALDIWVTKGIQPPSSLYPLIRKNELITAEEHKERFPIIPGMRHPGRNYQPSRINYGLEFREEGIMSIIPPELGEHYIALVPNFDRDGNSIGGIRLPELQAPLGTYQGWNPRQAQYGAPGYLARFEGSFWPFATTEVERKRNHDPRPSIEARYSSKKEYMKRIEKAVKNLIKQGFLLEEDGKRYIDFYKRIVWPPVPIETYPFWLREGMAIPRKKNQ